MEQFDFLKPYAQCTQRLDQEVLNRVVTCSSIDAELTLREGTCDIGMSTICSLVRKQEAAIDDDSPRHVGIDDFAVKKGLTYATCMTDAGTKQVVDMLPSRNKGDVSEWLAKFPNIETFSRDGSLEYRNAIEKAHPTALQVSDRFHLIKGVRDAAQQYINHLPPKIKLPNADEITDTEPSTGETEEHESESAALDTEDSLELTDSEKRRQKRVEEAREFRAEGHTWAEVAKHVGVTKQTAMECCREDYSPLSASRGKVSKLLLPFLEEIHKGRTAGLNKVDV